MTDQRNQDGALAPTTDEPGFGAAFAERSQDPQRDDTKQPADGLAPSNPEPAPARSEEPPASAASDPAPGGNAEAFDPWTGLTPEQKSYFERVKQSELSQRGRVGALTKKLQGQASRAAEAPQPAKQEPEGSGEEQVSDLDKRLQQVTEDYGDVVGPIAEVLKEVRAEIAGLKGKADEVQVEADAAEQAESLRTLERDHPDIKDHGVGSSFDLWLADQPAEVRDLANSYDPRRVSLALTLFKTERSAAIASQTGDEGEQGQQGGTATGDRRARQLEGSRQVPNRGTPAAAGTPNDFSAAFKARASAAR